MKGLVLLCFCMVFCVRLGHSSGREKGVEKLFVFGDSYADTGNIAKVFSPAWRPPYGITFPKKPAGRFSDGRVLPDYIASFLGIPSPLPYKYRKQGKNLFSSGMNFAVGGTGVFDTGNLQRNLSAQIDNFRDQLAISVVPSAHLRRSTALVSINGNDYLYLNNNGGSWEDLRAYIPKVVDQLKIDLKRIENFGVARVGVTNLHPIGCTPFMASLTSYRACNETANDAVAYHNSLLVEAVAELNGASGAERFVLIDLFSAFNSTLAQEMSRSEEALRPCCEGAEGRFRCGSTDDNGMPMYRVCNDPGSKFYWDAVHPTQAGWAAVVSALGSSLGRLIP